MTKQYIFLIFSVSLLHFSACKKDGAAPQKAANNANTPTCAYMSYEPVNGSYQYFLTFFDLSSAQTANKKYFKTQLKFVGVKDSFEIISAPQSINNLASGFPDEIVDHPGSGLLNQWTNPLYTLRTNGGGSYIKDTIVRNPQSNYYNFYLSYLSGPLKGKFPQSSFDGYNVPTGKDGQNTLHFRTVFYFSEGLCYDANNAESSTSIKPISALYQGAPEYDWKNVSTGLQIVSGGNCTFYFLDFKNWRYFRWSQFLNPVFYPAQLATKFEDYQSLDNFLAWPAGWGKK
jgi:hypothetical protein